MRIFQEHANSSSDLLYLLSTDTCTVVRTGIHTLKTGEKLSYVHTGTLRRLSNCLTISWKVCMYERAISLFVADLYSLSHQYLFHVHSGNY